MSEAGHPDRQEHGPSAGPAHEERDVRVRPIAIGIIGTLVLLGLVILLVNSLLNKLVERESLARPPRSPMVQALRRDLPPEPRLQSHPAQDLARMRQEEETVLGTFGWVDRKAGVVRMPIAQAMRQILERGVAPWPSPPGEQK